MNKRLLYHILFWAAYYLWTTFILASYDYVYYRAFMSNAITLPLKIAVTYFILYYLLPKYVLTRKYRPFFFILSILVVVSGVIFRVIQAIILPEYYPERPFTPWDAGRFMWGIFEIFSVAAVALSIKLFKSKYESQQREEELKKEKLQAELGFLKAQINPHFLFNTLNNIYVLSSINSPETPKSILRLSDLLRFMIKDGSMQKIKISDEIRILNDYIELERLRYGDRLDISIEKIVDNENELIAPLLLLPFVENSFKHGPSESRFKSAIAVSLKLENKVLTFKVSNSKEDDDYNSNGVGLKNIRRQLELIYGKDHHIEIKNSPRNFEVNLTINLKHYAEAELPHS